MPWADFWQFAPWVAAHASTKIDKCINQQRTSCKTGKNWQAKCKACRAVTRLQYTSMAGALQKLRVKWSKWFVSENAVCSRFGAHMQGSQFEMATVPKHTSNTQQYSAILSLWRVSMVSYCWSLWTLWEVDTLDVRLKSTQACATGSLADRYHVGNWHHSRPVDNC